MRDRLDDFRKNYELFRKYGEHENVLINYRMSWMLTIHGFLYATYGFTIQKLTEILEKAASFSSQKGGLDHKDVTCYLHDILPSINQIINFLWCIVMVGFVISLSSLLSIRAAYLASQTMHTIFYENYPLSDLAYASLPKRYRFVNWFLEKIGFMRNCSLYKPLYKLIEFGFRVFNLTPRPMKTLDVHGYTFPALNGGGRQASEFSGSIAAWIIPCVLLASWIFSAYYLKMASTYDMNIFSGSELCLSHRK